MLGDAKYIVFETPDGEALLAFPATLIHRDVANLLRPWKPVAAGFLSSALVPYGESMSLNVKARPDKDQVLVNRTFNLSA